MTTTEAPEESGAERELRRTLEARQAELRALRQRREGLEAALAPEVQRLRDDLEAAKAYLTRARAAFSAIGVERIQLKERVESARRQLKAKRDEETLLAIGESRRDEYQDWEADAHRRFGMRSHAVRETTAFEAKFALGTVISVVLFAVGLALSRC